MLQRSRDAALAVEAVNRHRSIDPRFGAPMVEFDEGQYGEPVMRIFIPVKGAKNPSADLISSYGELVRNAIKDLLAEDLAHAASFWAKDDG